MPLPSEPSPPIAAGTLIAERYRIMSVLGEGGMGIVYLAEHVHMRKRVAIKVLLPQWTSTPEVVARFEREAVAAGAISHPNVAAATDFGRLADGSFFLVLEYLEGRTLRAELAAGALPPVRALTVARGIALGVGAAHAKGIVHRDLKPENVMLVSRDGDPDFVKVLDFGIARVEARVGQPGRGGEVLTSAGAIIGTPDYMAPEQAMGSSIDARADVYSLGVMLFEMLTGASPFGGGAVTLLRQHILTPAPPVPDVIAVPAEARSLVARLLEKEASARYANAMEVVPVLERCVDVLRARSAPAIAVVPADVRRVPRASLVARALSIVRRRPRTAILAIVAASVVLTVFAPWYEGSASQTAPKPTASTVPTVDESSPSPPEAPPPTSSVASAEAVSSASSAKASPTAAPPHERHAGRRTGPGGIYIPPPSRWFH